MIIEQMTATEGAIREVYEGIAVFEKAEHAKKLEDDRRIWADQTRRSFEKRTTEKRITVRHGYFRKTEEENTAQMIAGLAS